MSINPIRVLTTVLFAGAVLTSIGAASNTPTTSHTPHPLQHPTPPLTLPSKLQTMVAAYSAAVHQADVAKYLTAAVAQAAQDAAAKAAAASAAAASATQAASVAATAQTAVTSTHTSATPVTEAPVTTTSPPPPPSGGYGDTSPADWQMTATCEEGGRNDPTYGYFGILPSTWAAYGGTAYSPTAGGSSESSQIAIEMNFQHSPPDVGRCSGGY